MYHSWCDLRSWLYILCQYFPHPTYLAVAADVNDFLGQSGWFSYQDLPQSKEALHRVLARLARMPYDHFMSCKEAVYKFDYRNGEKVPRTRGRG